MRTLAHAIQPFTPDFYSAEPIRNQFVAWPGRTGQLAFDCLLLLSFWQPVKEKNGRQILGSKNSVFRPQENEFIRVASLGNGRRRKNLIALRNNNRLDCPLAELLDPAFAKIGVVIKLPCHTRGLDTTLCNLF